VLLHGVVLITKVGNELLANFCSCMTYLTNRYSALAVSFVAAAAFLAVILLGAHSAYALVSTTLSPGASGSQVQELQAFLATDTAVYPEALITGYYGQLTTAAVQRFQCKEGIVCSGSVSTTGYGRVGPQTLARIKVLQGNGTFTGDLNAPILGVAGVGTTTNSATITWTTNEAARSRVMFGTAWPFLYATAPSVVDAGVDTVANVTLTGLLPNTWYFYVRESIDLANNVQYAIGGTFKTNP